MENRLVRRKNVTTRHESQQTRKVDREKHLGDVSPLYQHPTDEEYLQTPLPYR
ncbi:hypothetical protein KIN20_010256 [Parelaphostrongylus tenuis]|uniref:Uncharacterized protein n=1 Tax=Parelaphostrongylus tenuis TaxID=148309 RepID=A0AAD5MCA9_PARTN|nr:hypothetical protein KIN20_010256 [Parelaphostrongylus tenuis]